ncbi:hypothetical protein GCM10023214_65880 [Amycolatopsis dongchuanensis]|uniref:Phenyloxazoline synthase MbtB n=2 Tax=Amycolatopsis dongchuanensis TaxID=1070866 RepID=A0ABP8VHM1_9PSEU
MPPGLATGGTGNSLPDRLGAVFTETTGAPPPDPGAPLWLESLDALRFKSTVDDRFGVDLPLDALLGDGTLGDLARLVGEQRTSPVPRRAVVHDAANRHEPFPLTEIQRAYWLGAKDPGLGGRSAHAYAEVDLFGADVALAEDTLNDLITRHDMLRAVVRPDGRQQVLPSVQRYRIRHADLTDLPEETAQARLAATRAELGPQVFDATTWPLFEVRAHDLPGGRLRVHLSIDLLVADATSVQLLLAEWLRLVLDPASAEPAPAVTFRDVAGTGEASEKDRDYWLARVPDLPAAPRLPVTPLPPGTLPEFTRRQARLPGDVWTGLRELARKLGVTPSALLCAAYAEVLRTWSASPRFTLNLTLAQRPGGHPDVERVIGDFTGTLLLECDLTGSPDLATTARNVGNQLRADLAHASFSGVAVQRELARGRDASAARMPVVFTSLLREPGGVGALEGVTYELGYLASQTPQVFLDNQVLLLGGDLVVGWDAVEAMFPPGVLDDMFTAYTELLRDIAADPARAHGSRPVAVPRRQLAVRARVNDTAGPLPHEPIHAALDRQVAIRPKAPAVLADGLALSFGELDRRARHVTQRLVALGTTPGEPVAVLMHKGWEQVVAALGVVRAGAAYLPVDAGLPAGRIEQVLAAASVRTVVTQPEVPAMGRNAVVVGPESDVPFAAPEVDPAALAYVIFTSGSTGQPKGVVINHRAAVNTLADLNERLAVGPGDRVLGVSSLSFDLSVYDVFGVLGAGGAVVLPRPGDVRNPARLAELLCEHDVTLWNSVPAVLELVVDHAERTDPLPASLRAVLLSGDWIPLSLPDRIRAVSTGEPELHSLGGATEAAIWSIWHPIRDVDPGWRSVPYGVPLRNQTCHVLDETLAPKPDFVPGEIHIGGAGLADGYWGEPELTAATFLSTVDGRLYRTGDLGRYLPDGEIEFLGRNDTRVKVGGHRIELGEIESVLGGCPGVRAAVVRALGPEMGSKRLVAYIVGESEPDAVREFVAARLPSYMVPSAVVPLDRLPLTANGKVDRAALPEPPASSGEPPRTAAERALARVWAGLLGVPEVGRHDDFFALGGDSLLGVRAVAKAAEHGLHLTIGEFYRHPTVAGQAAVARQEPRRSSAAQDAGPVELTPSQRWFFEQGLRHPDHWNGMWPVFVLDRSLDPGALTRALTAVLAHHDGLRTRFRQDDDGWHAEIVPAAPAEPVAVVSLADVPTAELEEHIGAEVARRNGGLDLAEGPTVRLTYFDLGPDRPPRLLVSAHWLVMDYYSSRVFYEDLRSAYFALVAGEPPRLPPPTAPLSACLAELSAYARTDEVSAELPLWTRFADATPAPLPVDHRLGGNLQSSARFHFVTLPLPRAAGLRDALVAALVRTVADWTGEDEVLLELEAHGRERAYGELDVSRTVGRLSTLSPALLRTGSTPEIRAQLAAIPHNGVGYGVLRYLHPDPAVRAALAKAPRPEVGFNFWGEVSEYFTEDAHPVVESFGHHRSGLDHRPHTLHLTALTVRGELWLNWTYSANLHTEATVKALADRFTGELADQR